MTITNISKYSNPKPSTEGVYGLALGYDTCWRKDFIRCSHIMGVLSFPLDGRNVHLSLLSVLKSTTTMKKSPYTYFVSTTTVAEKVPDEVIYFVIGMDSQKDLFKKMMVKALEKVGETIKESDFVDENNEDMKCFGYPTYKVKHEKPKEGLVLAQRYFYNLGYRPHTTEGFVQIYELWRMRTLYLIVVQGKVVSKLHHLHEDIFIYNEREDVMTVQKCNEEINGYPRDVLETMEITIEKPHLAVTVYGVDSKGESDSNFCGVYTLSNNTAVSKIDDNKNDNGRHGGN